MYETNPIPNFLASASAGAVSAVDDTSTTTWASGRASTKRGGVRSGLTGNISGEAARTIWPPPAMWCGTDSTAASTSVKSAWWPWVNG